MPHLPPTAISRLLEQLSGLEGPRQPAKVLYPLPEILLLGLASSLAGADDVVLGKAERGFPAPLLSLCTRHPQP